MTPLRGASAILAAGVLLAWLAAAAGTPGSGTASRDAAGFEAVPADPILLQLQKESAKLQVRLSSATAPQSVSRNPFHFGVQASRRTPARNRLPESTPPFGQDSPGREPLPLSLIGIAEDAGAEGTVRTAVLSGFGQVFVVRVGAEITARFRVKAIGSDAVELLDVTDNSTITLALR